MPIIIPNAQFADGQFSGVGTEADPVTLVSGGGGNTLSTTMASSLVVSGLSTDTLFLPVPGNALTAKSTYRGEVGLNVDTTGGGETVVLLSIEIRPAVGPAIVLNQVQVTVPADEDAAAVLQLSGGFPAAGATATVTSQSVCLSVGGTADTDAVLAGKASTDPWDTFDSTDAFGIYVTTTLVTGDGTAVVTSGQMNLTLGS